MPNLVPDTPAKPHFRWLHESSEWFTLDRGEYALTGGPHPHPRRGTVTAGGREAPSMAWLPGEHIDLIADDGRILATLDERTPEQGHVPIRIEPLQVCCQFVPSVKAELSGSIEDRPSVNAGSIEDRPGSGFAGAYHVAVNPAHPERQRIVVGPSVRR